MGIIYNNKLLFMKEAANKSGKRKKKSRDKSLFRMGRYRREIIVSRLEPGSSPQCIVKKEQAAFRHTCFQSSGNRASEVSLNGKHKLKQVASPIQGQGWRHEGR